MCAVVVVRPEIAIVCQNCHRFFVPLRLWHGVIAVASILIAIILNERTGYLWISLVVGLVIAQLLLFAAVRSLSRKLLLFVGSLVLIPSSISVVASVVGFHKQLPPFLQISITWIFALCFLGLSIQLFVRWWDVGGQRNLSTWRILGTFSVALSCLLLILLLLLAAIPISIVPKNDPQMAVIEHMVDFRIGMLLLWLAYVVLLAFPGTFARKITLPQQSEPSSIIGSLVHIVTLSGRVIKNLADELIDGSKEIFAIGVIAFASVFRSLLFLVSATALQVAFCLLIDGYLRYMVGREVHLLQVASAILLLTIMLPALFWSAVVAAFPEILVVASNTLAMAGLVVVLCASIASWPWCAYEFIGQRPIGTNWLALFSAALLIATAAAVAILSRKEHNAGHTT